MCRTKLSNFILYYFLIYIDFTILLVLLTIKVNNTKCQKATSCKLLVILIFIRVEEKLSILFFIILLFISIFNIFSMQAIHCNLVIANYVLLTFSYVKKK